MMDGYAQSKEAYDRLNGVGYFEIVDQKVFNLLKAQGKSMDARELHTKLKENGDLLGNESKYNLVQQAFTRLSKSGKIKFMGKHKGMHGFTCGVYGICGVKEKEPDLFGIK
jgi:adenosylmethionine-8-amino-7-oxononanoate aminotransferase